MHNTKFNRKKKPQQNYSLKTQEMKKYDEQQKNVRNNRAFESLSKEIEFQELEIELNAKQIRELHAHIELKNQTLEENNSKFTERKEHLGHKKNELGAIMKETEKEESTLLKKSKDFQSKIDESLLISYKKIRSSVRNGLAVVAVERGASAVLSAPSVYSALSTHAALLLSALLSTLCSTLLYSICSVN